MTLSYTVGRLGGLNVGPSYTFVGGVQRMSLPMRRKENWPLPPKGTESALYMCGIEWSISADITEDLTDTGQDLIRAAFFNGDSLPFKAYIDATHYYSAEATVSEYGPAVDAEEPNDVSISLTPYKGYVLTSSL